MNCKEGCLKCCKEYCHESTIIILSMLIIVTGITIYIGIYGL